MRIQDIIEKKRYNNPLTDDEIYYFVNGFVGGDIPDYQISPLLMAICINGMNERETATLTRAMAESGSINDLSALPDTVDKHSTGGVGDKTTLIVLPIVASLGCTVAKLSGRALGHTGGTLDKLESVRGFDVTVSGDKFIDIAKQCGICVSGAGKNIAPADKEIYALRDVTATVRSVPLIASSIMSKKLAGGADSIVLDVKTGSGAFMQTLDEARELAECMVAIGKNSGKRISAVLTNMSHPLGYCVGNSVEVAEAVAFLKYGKGEPNLTSVCKTLATEMVRICKSIAREDALALVENVINNGKAYDKFVEWMSLQNGDASVLDDLDEFTSAKYKKEIIAQNSGYLHCIDAAGVGVAAVSLGVGRNKKEDKIDYTAGIVFKKTENEYVNKGDVIAVTQSSTVEEHTAVHNAILACFELLPVPQKDHTAVYEIIQ